MCSSAVAELEKHIVQEAGRLRCRRRLRLSLRLTLSVSISLYFYQRSYLERIKLFFYKSVINSDT